MGATEAVTGDAITGATEAIVGAAIMGDAITGAALARSASSMFDS